MRSGLCAECTARTPLNKSHAVEFIRLRWNQRCIGLKTPRLTKMFGADQLGLANNAVCEWPILVGHHLSPITDRWSTGGGVNYRR